MAEAFRLGVVTTHPIQYQAPLFRELASRSGLALSVFFNRLPDPEQQGKGFETSFTWDLPLLDGYPWKVRAGTTSANSETKKPTFASFTQAYDEVDVMLIHGWNTPYMRRAWWRGLWRDVPLLVRGESNVMRTRPLPLRLLHRWYLKPFDRYLYIGESSKQFYREAGVAPEALHPARYCIENQRFDEDWQRLKQERQHLRAKKGIDGEAICFVFCGKFIEKKRPGDIVRAFRKAEAASPKSMHLLMVGDGPLRQNLETETPEAASITFTGFLNQTEIGEAYAAADVMVLPSNYGETWGLVINEGMVFELPAIVSDRVGSVPDLIDEGQTGYTFPFGDVDALAQRIAQISDSQEEVRAMGKKARERVLTKYSIEKAADGIEQAARDAYATSTRR